MVTNFGQLVDWSTGSLPFISLACLYRHLSRVTASPPLHHFVAPASSVSLRICRHGGESVRLSDCMTGSGLDSLTVGCLVLLPSAGTDERRLRMIQPT